VGWSFLMGSAQSVEIRQARARTHGKARRILGGGIRNHYKQSGGGFYPSWFLVLGFRFLVLGFAIC
jgi:hypothetical protein